MSQYRCSVRQTASLHVAPVDRGRVRMSRHRCGRNQIRGTFLQVQFVPRPRSIRALACPDALVLALHSNHSYGYGFRSRAASKRIWPARSSRILMQHAGWGVRAAMVYWLADAETGKINCPAKRNSYQFAGSTGTKARGHAAGSPDRRSNPPRLR